jgi:hypothetical protein
LVDQPAAGAHVDPVDAAVETIGRQVQLAGRGERAALDPLELQGVPSSVDNVTSRTGRSSNAPSRWTGWWTWSRSVSNGEV